MHVYAYVYKYCMVCVIISALANTSYHAIQTKACLQYFPGRHVRTCRGEQVEVKSFKGRGGCDGRTVQAWACRASLQQNNVSPRQGGLFG